MMLGSKIFYSKKEFYRKRYVLLFVFLMFFLFIPKSSHACMTCNGMVSSYDGAIWGGAERDFDNKLNREFLRLERFIVYDMWTYNILPVMFMAAEQLTAVAIYQVMYIGMVIDAKSQLETQQYLQVLQARAHKDYHPSEQICKFGTAMKSLASSEMQGEFSSYVISQRSMERQLGKSLSSGMYGLDTDRKFRIAHFKEKYCTPFDRSNGLVDAMDILCERDITEEGVLDKVNKDIDFFTTVSSPWTLKINFLNQEIEKTDTTPEIHNEDEEHVLALASNLFADDLFIRPPAKTLEHIPGKPVSAMQEAYMDMRSLVAKRSVAENSFNMVTGMKSEGRKAFNGEGEPVDDAGGDQLPMRNRLYLMNIVKSLGVPNTEIFKILGNDPSYDAQMQILTKKIFQNPDFYTNLYDKPANVQRISATLQAIKLMQKFDTMKSYLRSENSFSVLLELSVSELQREIEAQIN